MIKRIFHIFLALTFPVFVLSVLLLKVLFKDKGIGDKWLLNSDEMIDNIKGVAR